MTRGARNAPSYWISGELRSGKTSFLLKLESLLVDQLSVSGNRWLTFPLLVSCAACTGLQDFYQRILKRAEGEFGKASPVQRPNASPIALSARDCRLMGPQASRLQAADLLDSIRQDLGTLLRQLPAETGRLLLLVDDAETITNKPWSKQLFLHLRSLLVDQGSEFLLSQCALVIAGSEDLAEQNAFVRLLDVITYKEQLGPLSPTGVGQLIDRSGSALNEPEWVARILYATGGHPWLVQYLMDCFVTHCRFDKAYFSQRLDDLIGRRFQQEPGVSTVLLEWLQRFKPPSKEVINALAIAPPEGAVITQLAETLELAERDMVSVLSKLESMGLVYRVPTSDGDHGERFGLAEMFKLWYLEHTGGKVLRQEIDRLRRAATPAQNERPSAPLVPFSLFVSLKHQLVLADGFHAAFSDMGGDFPDELEVIVYNTRRCKNNRDLDILSKEVGQKFSKSSDWLDRWRDYVISAEHPLFLLRIADRELLDFPVELIEFNGRFLGLEAPVAKEIVGLEAIRNREHNPAYHLRERLFTHTEPINVLLVANGRGGILDDRVEFRPLVHAEKEVTAIRQLLCAADGSQAIRVGTILVLSTDPKSQAGNSDTLELSMDNFARALRGELGVEFDLIHFSGHSQYAQSSEDEHSTGLLLPGDGNEMKLYNLAQLRGDLQRRESRLAMIYLSSCVSAQHDSQASLYLGAAHTCLASGVPAVIGMRWPIVDADAEFLALSFYRDFLTHGVPERALLAARRKMHEHGMSNIAWAAPVMLCR